MKRIIELSIKGVGLALALFAVFGLVADVANQGVFTLKNYNYTKMVIGAVIVGLGFSVPGIVYETTVFSYAVKILIHMGTGCVIFLITGYAVGWFSLAGGIRQCMPPILASLGTSVLLWVVFMLRDRRTAERINERIRELEDEDEVHVTKEA